MTAAKVLPLINANLADLVSNPLDGYSDASEIMKLQFHSIAKTRLLELAEMMRPEVCRIRSNKGGPAVSGEITLHTDSLYVQVGQSLSGRSSDVLYRTCKGLDDYTGGPNHYAPITVLDDLPGFANTLHGLRR